jgi:hypothetical protein
MEYLTSAKLKRVMTGGHNYIPLKSQITRSGILINIFKKHIEGIITVVMEIPPPRYDFPTVEPKTKIEDIQDSFFKDMQDTMQEMQDLGINISAIVFHGGGTMNIPDWFKDFCEENDIQILTYNPNPDNADNPINDDEFNRDLTNTESRFPEKRKMRQLREKLPELEGIF